MCGRFSLAAIAEVLTDRFSMSLGYNVDFALEDEASRMAMRFNIAPTQEVPILINAPTAAFSFLRWGLIPHYAKEQKAAFKMINARAETIMEKPTFKGLFAQKRCIVPATGFYEWRKSDRAPFHFQLRSEEIFAMAGIWDSWKDSQGRELRTFSIITTSANALVKDLHDRMPVILDRAAERYWLEDHAPEELIRLLRPLSAEQMKRYEVSRAVNAAREDTSEMVKPLAAQTRL